MEYVQRILEIWKAIKAYFNEIGGLSMKMKVTFAFLLSICVLLIVSSGLVGCMSPQKAYIEANYRCSQTMLPDFIEYVSSDAKLSELDKETRAGAINEWKKLLEMAYLEMKEK